MSWISVQLFLNVCKFGYVQKMWQFGKGKGIFLLTVLYRCLYKIWKYPPLANKCLDLLGYESRQSLEDLASKCKAS